MNKQLSPNLVSALLVVITILILVALPFYLEVTANEAQNADQAHLSTLKNIDRTDINIVEFTLRTSMGGDPVMSFVGVGDEIDGISNPDLVVKQSDLVRITIINGDPMPHDLTIDAFNVSSGQLIEDEQTVTIEFMADRVGDFVYYCSVPGHREVGMEGLLKVKAPVGKNNLPD